MRVSLLAITSVLVGLSAAQNGTAGRICMNATVPVSITARNGVFNIGAINTNLDATTFAQNNTRQGGNFTLESLTGYATINNTYNISTMFCMPSNATAENPVVQVLTHGIGFDKTYWDLSYNNFNYSYINSAIAAGYCTLSYDRLGIGNSSHGEPVNEIQAALEIQALHALVTMLAQGTFPGVNHTFGTDIVMVGHSYGSAQSYSFVNMYPNLVSGVVLTGFSMNSSFVGLFGAGSNFQIANQNQPLRFGDVNTTTLMQYLELSPFADFVTPINLEALPAGQNLPNGYLVSSDVEANQYLFFAPPFFDTGLLFVAEQTKQPVTIGELLTLGSLTMTNNFAGPVLVVTGDYDLPYCGGNCSATGGAMPSVISSVAMNFPNVTAANFTAYVQPNSGHGINAHYNSTGAYAVIQNFLKGHSIMSS